MKIKATAEVTVRVTVRLDQAVSDETPHRELVGALKSQATKAVADALHRGQVQLAGTEHAVSIGPVTVTEWQ